MSGAQITCFPLNMIIPPQQINIFVNPHKSGSVQELRQPYQEFSCFLLHCLNQNAHISVSLRPILKNPKPTSHCVKEVSEMIKTFSLSVLVLKIRCFEWGTSDVLEKNISHLSPAPPTKKLAQFLIQAC